MFKFKYKAFAAACLAAGAISAAPTAVHAQLLTFEGLGNTQAVGNYYNGGAGGNDGISFGADSLALISDADGGTGNFSGNPSGDTVIFFESGAADEMDVAAGFTNGLSFYYASSQAGTVNIYSGLDGTGTLLASLALAATATPYTVWDQIGVSFAGTAESVEFGGSANYIAFDNISVGANLAAIPEPASIALLGAGLAGLIVTSRRTRHAATRPA
jgi:hypothetical protein